MVAVGAGGGGRYEFLDKYNPRLEGSRTRRERPVTGSGRTGMKWGPDRLAPAYRAGRAGACLSAARSCRPLPSPGRGVAREPAGVMRRWGSFFGALTTGLVPRREYPDRGAARRDLFAYVEGYCKRWRLRSAIGPLTPQQAEAEPA
jgi:hypothetical protein